MVFSRNLGKVVPVSNRVDPGKEHNRPGGRYVESNVLIELDDAI